MGLEPITTIPTEGGLPPVQLPLPVPIVGAGAGADPSSITAALGRIVAYASAINSWLQGYTGALVSQLESALKNILGMVAGWLKRIADTWLGQTIKNIWTRVLRIYKQISTELKQIIAVIRKYEAMVEAWETKILKPAMDLIQQLRRILAVFRIFHFRFATQLDNYLAAREAQLAKIWIETRREMNRVLDYLNLIFDPFGYFSPALYIGSAIKTAGQMLAVLWNAQYKPPTSAQLAQGAALSERANFDAVERRMKVSAGIGLDDYDQANVNQAFETFRSMGYPV